jgi:hypothetical protein
MMPTALESNDSFREMWGQAFPDAAEIGGYSCTFFPPWAAVCVIIRGARIYE